MNQPTNEMPTSGGLTRLLERLAPLLGLTAVLLAALAYPLRLHETVLAPLEQSTGWAGWLYHHEVRPVLAYTLSPLTFKETLSGCVLLAMSCAWMLLRILQLPEAGASTGSSLWSRIRRGAARPEPWIVALIIYAALSSIPPIGLGMDWLFRTPTYIYSLKTLLPFTLGLMLVMVFTSAAQPRSLAAKFMLSMCLAAAVIVLISILQHLEVKGRWWFMAPWEGEPRNRMGSLIGHNTGLSSWLLFPLSFSIFYLLTPRRLVARAAAAVLTLAILFVLVAAQSRAVWGLAAIGLPVYVWLQFRAIGYRPGLKTWLVAAAVLLAIIASQVVAPERNPFARHDVTLKQRVSTDVLSLDQLLRETRLRVIRASLPLIAERPILGHGLGSFQWVYPPAQGQYFRDGIGVVTGFTTKRTNVAHTDYIQYLVEMGLLGLVLAGVPLFLLLRAALRARRQLVRFERARLNALLFPLAAVALHAWIDFPAHIVPIALAALACLTLAAGAKGWLDLGSPDTDSAAAISLEPAKSAPGLPLPRFRPGHAIALTATGVVFLLSGYATVFLGRTFVADIYFVDGSNWLNTAQVTPYGQFAARFDYLNHARRNLKKSTHLDPAFGEAYEKLSFTHALLGELNLTLAAQAKAGGDKKKAEEFRLAARSNYESAVQIGRQQLDFGELRWHYTYYLLGQAFRALWQLNPDPNDIRQSNYLKMAEASLQRAVEFNLADPPSVLELASLLETKPAPDRQAAARLRAILYKVDPWGAWEYLLKPAAEAAERGDFAQAWKLLERADPPAGDEYAALARARILLESALWPPSELDLEPDTSASLAYRNERLAAIEPLLPQLQQPQKADPGLTLQLQVEYHTARGNYAKALELADRLATIRPWDRKLRVLQSMLAEKIGQKREVPGNYLTGAHGQAKYHHFRTRFFGEKIMGTGQMAHVAKFVPLTLPEGLRAVAFLRKAGNQWDKIQTIAQNLAQSFPNNSDVQKLRREATEQTTGTIAQ